MVQFIQNFFLSPFLIFIILIAVFFWLSWWAIQRRKEYVGYGLGWLIGVFGMVIYGALVGDPPAVAQTDTTIPNTLNIFQVTLPSILGLVLGAWSMSLIRQTSDKSVQKSIVVALLTALALWVLFLMIVSTAYPTTQRMIGIFALAFAIGALTMLAVFRQSPTRVPQSDISASSFSAQADQRNIPSMPPHVDEGKSIRDRIRRR